MKSFISEVPKLAPMILTNKFQVHVALLKQWTPDDADTNNSHSIIPILQLHHSIGIECRDLGLEMNFMKKQN